MPPMAQADLPRLRRVFGDQLADSVRKPLPRLTPRRVFGRVRFPGKVTVVTGMRRAGKTTFLHQLRGERLAEGAPASGCPTSRSRTSASRTSTQPTSACCCPSTTAGFPTRTTVRR